MTSFPNGMMLDEWSMLYDSWCLGHFGVDRNGYSFPVYLKAWGSGQSVLLAYLTIPFVLMFGINQVSGALAICFVSILSIIALFFLVKKVCDVKMAFVCMLLFAILPWDMMNARWGLDCNLLPAFLIFGTLFFVKAVKDNWWWFLLSGFFYGLSLYTYGLNWFFLPIFLICVYIILLIKKKIKWTQFILGNVILLLFAMPLLLFLMVNLGILEEFKIFGLFSVPKLSQFRPGGFSDGILSKINTLYRIFVLQDDGLIWNRILPFGALFPISLPFIVCGFIYFLKNIKKIWKENIIEFFMFLWFAVGLITGFAVAGVAINHFNYVLPAMIFVIAKGILWFSGNLKKILLSIGSLYLVCSVCFLSCYFGPTFKQTTYNWFSQGIEDAVNFAEEKRSENENISIDCGGSYYVILCSLAQISPFEFQETVCYEDETVGIRQVKSVSHFKLNVDEEMAESDIYILKDGSGIEIKEDWKTEKFGSYIVCFK